MAFSTFASGYNRCTWQQNTPPAQNGNSIYAVTLGSSSSAEINIWKMTYSGATHGSWSEQDNTANPTTGSTYNAIASVQVGTTIHIASITAAFVVQYHAFSMSSDTWTTVNQTVDTLTDINNFSIAIGVRSDGDKLIVYPDDIVRIKGKDWDRISYALHEGSSWSVGNAVDDGGEVKYYGIVGVMDNTDKFHIFYRTDADHVYHKSLSSTNSLSSVEQCSTSILSTTIANSIAQPAVYDTGSIDRVTVGWRRNSDNLFRTSEVDNDGTPSTAETGSVLAVDRDPVPNYILGAIVADEATDTAYTVWVFDTTPFKELYFQSNVNSAGWNGTDTAISFTLSGTTESLAANILTNASSDTVIGAVTQNSALYRYDDYVVVTGSSDLPITGVVVTSTAAVQISSVSKASALPLTGAVVTSTAAVQTSSIAKQAALSLTGVVVTSTAAVQVSSAALVDPTQYVTGVTVTSAAAVQTSIIANEAALSITGVVVESTPSVQSSSIANEVALSVTGVIIASTASVQTGAIANGSPLSITGVVVSSTEAVQTSNIANESALPLTSGVISSTATVQVSTVGVAFQEITGGLITSTPVVQVSVLVAESALSLTGDVVSSAATVITSSVGVETALPISGVVVTSTPAVQVSSVATSFLEIQGGVITSAPTVTTSTISSEAALVVTGVLISSTPAVQASSINVIPAVGIAGMVITSNASVLTSSISSQSALSLTGVVVSSSASVPVSEVALGSDLPVTGSVITSAASVSSSSVANEANLTLSGVIISTTPVVALSSIEVTQLVIEGLTVLSSPDVGVSSIAGEAPTIVSGEVITSTTTVMLGSISLGVPLSLTGVTVLSPTTVEVGGVITQADLAITADVVDAAGAVQLSSVDITTTQWVYLQLITSEAYPVVGRVRYELLSGMKVRDSGALSGATLSGSTANNRVQGRSNAKARLGTD